MPEYDIHERAAVLFTPDTLLATQYFDRVSGRTDLMGEKRLMIAVIEQAVDDYMKPPAATDCRRRKLCAEAQRWIECADRSWLYSFETICDHLGLDANCVRAGLRGRKMRACGEPVAATSDVAAPSERRRASNE